MGKFGQQDTKKTQRNKIIKKGIKMARTSTNESHMQQHIKKFQKCAILKGSFIVLLWYWVKTGKIHTKNSFLNHFSNYPNYKMLLERAAIWLLFSMRLFMSFYEENRKEQKKFYDSGEWKACRQTYLSEHPLCERCLAAGIASTAEHVHHKIELNESNYKNPLITLNPDNLEALCFDCHRKEHHDSKQVGEGLCFDADGNLIQQPTG